MILFQLTKFFFFTIKKYLRNPASFFGQSYLFSCVFSLKATLCFVLYGSQRDS